MVENNTEEQAVPKLKNRDQLAESGLSKRNQDFMWQVQSLASADQVNTGMVADIEAQLLAGQKTGQTAKQIYGTPKQALGQEIKEVQQGQNQGANYAANGFWNIAIDNTFVFLMMFSLMFGVMLMFSSEQIVSEGAQASSLGITALILTAVSGGGLFAAWTLLMAPAKNGQKTSIWLRILGSLLIFATWFILYMAFGLIIPSVINPILPGWIYLIVAGTSFIGFQWWRRKTGMQGGFLGGANRK